MSRDGKTLALVIVPAGVQLVDLDSGELRGALEAPGGTTPTGLALGPHGLLYATSDQTNSVTVIDPVAGLVVDTLVPMGGGGINGGTFVSFVRQ